ncbi:MAG: type II secretion system F family protein [Candidatus Paceibacterota bacterium]|jgi:type IV pilus assembly protein PilC|nr:type II secretion system F family protein [bacterium]
MKFNFKAKDQSGKIEIGTIEANSKEEAIAALSKKDIFLLALEEKDKGNIFKTNISFSLFKNVSVKEIVIFSRELAIMIESNVSPSDALDALAAQTRNKVFRSKILKISTDIRGGLLMSKSFSKHPELFSVFYINMLRSGEASGGLPKILDRIADHLESEYAIRQKTITAMIYPAMIMTIFILIFIIIMIFVIPNLITILESTGKELPFATKIIISISQFFTQFWYLAITAAASLAAFVYYYPKTKEGKDFTDKMILKVPIFGHFLRDIYISRFAENLSTLISAGIQINEALDIVANIVGNNVYRDIILKTKDRVMKGESFSFVLSQYPEEISPLFTQMAAVGERTGKLDSSLVNVVRFYSRETENFVNSISSMIEPIMIVGLALMVGFLVAAVLLPIYQISTSIQ